MNGGKEIGDSLGRNKTAQFSLTECLSNYLTQWKRSQNITAKYLWNKMYNSAGTWHDAWAPHEALTVSDLVGVANRTADGTRSRGRGCESREEGGDGALGKNECPDQTKMGPDAKSGGVAKGVFEPVTEEMSSWAGCWWKHNLSAMINYISQSVSVLTGSDSRLLQVLCTQDFI